MTNQNNQNNKEENFLNLIYQDICQIVDQHQHELPDKWPLIDALANKMQSRVIESFKNGIETGQKKLQKFGKAGGCSLGCLPRKARQSGQDPRHEKAEKAIDEAMDRTRQKDNSRSQNKYKN